MFGILLSASVLLAPPSKPDPAGGWITLWLGEKPVRFRPNGNDVTPIEQAIDTSLYPYGPRLTPDGKSVFALDMSSTRTGVPEQRGMRSNWGRLVVSPLDGKGETFVLPGYCLTRIIESSERDRVYFWGVEGGKYDPEKPKKLWLFDFASRKVAPFTPKLPEKHSLIAVGKDGQALLTSRSEKVGATDSYRSYFISADRKPVELLKENAYLMMPQFSPDGSKFFGIVQTLKKDLPKSEVESPRFVVIDVNSGKETMLTGAPKAGVSGGWTSAGDSSGVAFIWHDPNETQRRGPRGSREINSYKLLCCAADGSGCREIYKADAEFFCLIDWR